MQVRSPKDLWAGVLFMAIGAIALATARSYPMGTANQMGPGYLPTVLSCGTIALGAIVAGRSFLVAGEPLARIVWRPLLLILGAVTLFSLMIDRAGLVATTMATVLAGGLAAPGMSKLELVVLSVGLAMFCGALFVGALGQPMALWPW